MADIEKPSGESLDPTGNATIVTPELEVVNRSISSVSQAYAVCDQMIEDFKKGISVAKRITAKINGERPYDQSKLKQAAKDWKANVSTGFLSSECGKVIPRFYMPVKTAKYLTAAELPPGHAEGAAKANFFRQVITDAVRSWPKYNFFLRGLAREVAVYGFAFCWFPDEYDWRPSLLRMDKGFVPQGTEVLEEPQFFLARYDYKPYEILQLLKDNIEAGRDEWKKDAVVSALKGAQQPATETSRSDARTYEDLIRQANWGYSYSKGIKVVRTWHLFAKESTGWVSHYVLLIDGSKDSEYPTDLTEARLLYEKLDKFQNMKEVVQPIVFDYGDGTIHGSWGVGQILYDLSVQVEKVRNDSIDNIRLTNKVKIQVPEAKNSTDVKQLVNDQFVVVSGGTFAGNTAGITSDAEGYEVLDQKLTNLAQQKIGSFVPPIPLQPSDIKAAQVNAAMMKERELQEALLENWLIQFAEVMRTICRRLTNTESPDPIAQAVLGRLLTRLTAEEIMVLADQFPVKSVMDFTEYKAQQRGMFAANVKDNPMFNQRAVARFMAEGAGDEQFVQAIMEQDGDQSQMVAAQRAQILESTTLETGRNVPVLQSDNDWGHMQTLKPEIQAALTSGNPNLPAVVAKLEHYAGHWNQGVAKKTLPKDQINSEKQWIAEAEKAIAAYQESLAIQQARAQAEQGAMIQAEQMVASGQA